MCFFKKNYVHLRNILKWKQIKKIKNGNNYHDTLTKKVKKAYKTPLKVLCALRKASVSHNEGKTVYISGTSLYKEHAAAFEKIFNCCF